MKTSINHRNKLLLTLGLLCIILNGCEKDNLIPVPTPGNPITDIDGNVYKTVIIGSQTWMAENLRTKRYCNGDTILHAMNERQWSSLGSKNGAYSDFQNEPFTGSILGNLYNWYAVNSNLGLAPKGWHVASKNDWQILIDYLGGEEIAGGKLKDTQTKYWKYGNIGATNETGFSAVQCGFIISRFEVSKYTTTWWTSTEDYTNGPWFVTIWSENEGIGILNGAQRYVGFPVRCIKDN
jgi:uncharacterized protein (TIGR02145 family)